MQVRKKKKILFTGGGGAGNEAIWRILNSKYDLFFADCNIDNIDPVIPSDRRVEIPMANAPDFLPRLTILSRELGLDFLVPGVDEELISLSKNKEQFNCQVFTPDDSFVCSMLDKYSCANAIKCVGLTAPQTFYVNDSHKLEFPMIIKPKSGRGSRGVMTIGSKEELAAYRVFHKDTDKNLIVQELIKGQEYTILVSANNQQELNCIIPIKVAQKKGITINASLEMNETIIDYVKKFHDNFPTSCIYNIQCILTESGDVYPFEVNPRISTTFCMSLAAGFDPFEQFYQSVLEMWEPEELIYLIRSWKNNFSN